MHRKDDTKEALLTRMGAYHTSTTPILDFYRKKQLLTSINASAPMGNVKAEIEYSLYV